ncbi:MAG: type II CAAX endopeptidase family protein [Saprospiraceae bacterium]
MNWQTGELYFALSLASVALAFAAYHFLNHADRFRTWIADRAGEADAPVQVIVFQRLSGLVILGLIPLAVALAATGQGFGYFGLSFSDMDQVLIWTLVASVILLPIGYLNARRADNQAMYPQMRLSEWSYGLLLWSNLTWVLYLLGYEILFRGILFFPILDHYGLVVAISANAAVYSLAHIPKGLKETIGAIPFGIIVCLVAEKTGNIWFPFLVHCVMALSNEWFSIFQNPNMHLKKSQ